MNRHLSIDDICKFYGVCRETVLRWIHHGCRGVRLSAVMVGGVWRVDPEDWEAFVAAQTRAAMTPDCPQPAAPEFASAAHDEAMEDLRRLGFRV